MRHRMTVNGAAVEVDIEPATRLIDVLRDQLGLKGTKEACGRGECGSCTVLVGGEPQVSCLALAIRVTDVDTIEGLVEESRAFRAAIADTGGFQCGFCTPGHVVTAVAQLRANPRASREDRRRAMAGNICRCTGYQGLVDAYDVAEEGIVDDHR